MVSFQVAERFWTFFRMFVEPPADPQVYTTYMCLRRSRAPTGSREPGGLEATPWTEKGSAECLLGSLCCSQETVKRKAAPWISRGSPSHCVLEVTWTVDVVDWGDGREKSREGNALTPASRLQTWACDEGLWALTLPDVSSRAFHAPD